MNRTIIEDYLNKLRGAMSRGVEGIGGWEFKVCEYIKPGEYKVKSDWKPFESNIRFSLDDTVFLRTMWKVPDVLVNNETECDYLAVFMKNFEGLVTIDGVNVQGINPGRNYVPINPALAGRTVELAVEFAGCFWFYHRPEGPEFHSAAVSRFARPVESFYYDLRLAWETYNFADSEYIKKMLMRAIEAGLSSFDITLSGEALNNSCKTAQKRLNNALSAVESGDVRGRISLIGHTHIDIAWLWPVKDTIRKAGRTFLNVIRLMEEYPDFKFTCTQPFLFDCAKKYYPKTFAQLKEYVKSGRLEPVNPMWVESDCNLISGESLVRQILYGYNFYKDEFGIVSDISWLPDSFGFQGNIPQIFRKSGIKYFYTYKVHWQAPNRFPYPVFRWQGIDNSEVIAATPNLIGGYNGVPNPQNFMFAANENLNRGDEENMVLPYGWGDGGGGPDKDMLEFASRISDYPGLPKSKQMTAAEYFKIADRPGLPKIYGDLYHEAHQGTYTSRARGKMLNRKSELALRRCEILSAIAGQIGYAYKNEALTEIWKDTLVLQFHDILPGSSIAPVYADAEITYTEILKKTDELTKNAIDYIADVIELSENELLLFNTLSWKRDAVVDICTCSFGDNVNDLKLTDCGGNELIYTVNGETVSIAVKDIPAMGYKKLRISKGGAIIKAESFSVVKFNTSDRLTVENNRYFADITSDGKFLSLIDKNTGRQVFTAAGGNEFKFYFDGPQIEDAWNLYPEYMKRPAGIDFNNSIRISENSALRTVITVIREAEKVVITQDIIFYADSPVIDFRTTVDWRELHKLMKVSFPLNVMARSFVCETGFGAIERTCRKNNPYECAQYVISAHRYVDMSEEGFGVSVLNDCKYGHDVEDEIVSITLLRSTNGPMEKCDIGTHEFTYSLYPHEGNFAAAGTVFRAHELNEPVFAYFPKNGTGAKKGAGCLSFANTSGKRSIIDSIKKAEDGSGYIFRVYEPDGGRGRTVVNTSFAFGSVTEKNLVEQDMDGAGEIIVFGNSFEFDILPFEIKTFLIKI